MEFFIGVGIELGVEERLERGLVNSEEVSSEGVFAIFRDNGLLILMKRWWVRKFRFD